MPRKDHLVGKKVRAYFVGGRCVEADVVCVERARRKLTGLMIKGIFTPWGRDIDKLEVIAEPAS